MDADLRRPAAQQNNSPESTTFLNDTWIKKEGEHKGASAAG